LRGKAPRAGDGYGGVRAVVLVVSNAREILVVSDAEILVVSDNVAHARLR